MQHLVLVSPACVIREELLYELAIDMRHLVGVRSSRRSKGPFRKLILQHNIGLRCGCGFVHTILHHHAQPRRGTISGGDHRIGPAADHSSSRMDYRRRWFHGFDGFHYRKILAAISLDPIFAPIRPRVPIFGRWRRGLSRSLSSAHIAGLGIPGEPGWRRNLRSRLFCALF